MSLRFALCLNPLTLSDAIVRAKGILLGSFVDKYLHDLVTKQSTITRQHDKN